MTDSGPGRPTFLTIDLVYKIVKLVREGIPPSDAAAAMGVVRRNYNNWMQRARQDLQLERESVYRELAEGIEQARAEWRVETIGKLNAKREHPFTSLKDLILLMERADPENWRKRETHEILGTVNQRVQVEQLTSPEDEDERLGRTLAIMDEVGQIPRRSGPETPDGVIEAEAHEIYPTRPESEAISIPEPDGA